MKYNKHKFKNGLRLVTVPIKSTRAVTVLVLVGAGSKYETKSNNGVSHFLEHMFFKGTKKRPTTLDIAETLDKVGGEFDAFTGKEVTGYYAKVDAVQLDLAIDWVSDILLNSKLENKEIQREKGVIIEEINMYLDTPVKYIGDLFEQLLYKDQPAGWKILGEKKNVKQMKREQFINYLKNYYKASNTVAIVAGNIGKLKEVESKVQNCFRKIKKGKASGKKKVVEKQNKPQVLINHKKTDQAHFYLGVRGYSIFSSKKYIQDIISVILGGNMSSRLWTSVRGRSGLGYYIRSFSKNYTDTGYLVTQAGVDNNNVKKAIKIILEEYKKIAQEKIGEKELKKAKDYIRGSAVLELESSDEVAIFFGAQEILTNNILTPKQKLDKIEAVTIDDVYKVANEIFRPENLNLALIGPYKNSKEFEKLLKL